VFAERAQLAARELGDGEVVRRAPERPPAAGARPAVVGAANDPAEREADTMAAAALRALDGGNV